MRVYHHGRAPITLPSIDYQSAFDRSLARHLDPDQGRAALRLFRSGKDTSDIASIMEATQSAVANAIARARDEERRAG